MAEPLATPELRPAGSAEPALSTQGKANDAQAPVQVTQSVDPQKQTGGDAQAPEAASSAQTEEKKISPKEAEELFRSVDEILKAVSAESGFPIKHEVKKRLTESRRHCRVCHEAHE
jgi:nucleoid-associated protein YgaU